MEIGRKLLAAAALVSAPMVFYETGWAQEQPAPRTQVEATRAFLAHKQQIQSEKAQRIADAANLGALERFSTVLNRHGIPFGRDF